MLEGVARVDTNRLIGSLLALKPQHGSEVGFVKETFGDAAKAMAVYKVWLFSLSFLCVLYG